MTKFFENERELVRWAVAEARDKGWLAVAFDAPMRIVRKPGGPIAIPNKDAAGFPDVVLVHPTHGLVFIEFKLDPKSPLKPEQVVWLRALAAAGQRVYVFRAHEQAAILSLLAGAGMDSMLFDRGEPVEFSVRVPREEEA